MSIVERRLNKSLRHNDLQHALGLYLIEQHGEGYVGDEQAAVAGGKIDLVVSDGSTRTYYEVKIAGRSRSCIRQALGKLLEYSYWPGAQTARKLVIVGEMR